MIKLIAALALLAPMASAQQILSTLEGRNRVLLVFAPNALDPRFGLQLNALEHHEAELASRDLVLIPLLEQPGPPNPSPVLRNLRPPLVQAEEQIWIRRRFNVAFDDFTVVLLAKNDVEKLRAHAPVSAARLKQTLDALHDARK